VTFLCSPSFWRFSSAARSPRGRAAAFDKELVRAGLDLEEKTLQPLHNPFGPKVLPMS